MEFYVKKKEIDWSALPWLVLSLVADKLNHVTEFARFGVVCTSWHAIYKDIRDSTLRDILQEPLLLMLPDVDDKKGQLRTLYSLNQKKVYKHIRLLVPHDEICVGSSHGWPAMLSYDHQLRFLNPLLSVNNEIKLPAFPVYEWYEDDNVLKVEFSGDPISNPNYAIMAIHGIDNTIAFYDRGNKEWTDLDSRINDVVYSDSDHKFYAVCYHTGEILAYDLNGDSFIETPELNQSQYATKYLVKSGSDIFQVTRHIAYEIKQDPVGELPNDCDSYYTDIVQVYKFDPNNNKWNEVKTLDRQILFVGYNSSLALSASDMPGCKPNCVYFTDDHCDCYVDEMGARDTGFYSLEDGVVQLFNLEDDGSIQLCDLENGSPVPIFIQPPPTHRLTF